MKNEHLRLFMRTVATVVCCALVGLALMMIVSLLPVEPIENNVRQSIYTLEKEGEWPYVKSINGTQQKDNFSDALILAIAANDKDNGIIDQALSCEYFMVDGQDPYHSTYLYYNRPGETYENVERIQYARYWHGYLVLLKPLLMGLKYYQIRKVFLISQLLLVAAVVLLMIVKKMYRYAVPFLLSIVLLSPSVIAQSMHFSWAYYVMLLSCIAVLIFEKQLCHAGNRAILFTLIGCLTSYVDLLTAPLMTLGFPLVLYICMDKQEKNKCALLTTVQLCACWAIGYLGMWASKWVIASILTQNNIILDAINTVALRTSFNDFWGNKVTYAEILERAWGFIKESPVVIISVVIMAAGIAVSAIQGNIRNLADKACRFGILMCLPFMWIYVVSNHTYIHAYFAHRILGVAFFAGMCLCVSGIRFKKG